VLQQSVLDTKTRARVEAWGKKRRFYKPLPTQFRHNGFDCRQIDREASAVTCEQIWNGCANAAISYEVVLIWRREGFQIDDRFVEPAEVYPNSEASGVGGWTAEDKDAAFRKLRQVIVESAHTSRSKRTGAMSIQSLPIAATSEEQSAIRLFEIEVA
jgi:hypothetical protein